MCKERISSFAGNTNFTRSRNSINTENSKRKKDKWDSLFDLSNSEEISKLENEINLAVNCEKDHKGHLISLFLADYGVKKRLKDPLKEGEESLMPDCTLFLNSSYFEELKKKNGLKKLKKHCATLTKRFGNSKRMDLKIIDFHPEENILDNYLRESYSHFATESRPIEIKEKDTLTYPFAGTAFAGRSESGIVPNLPKRSSTASGTKVKANVSLYCFSSPRDPEVCFGRSNVKKRGFQTEFHYSIFDLAPFDTRPDYEILLEKGLKENLKDNTEFKEYKKWKEFSDNLERDRKVVPHLLDLTASAADTGDQSRAVSVAKIEELKLNETHLENLFLKDPVGFLDWNWVKTRFLFIAFVYKLSSTNRVLRNGLSFEKELEFKYDFPATADKMVEQIFSRYLKKHIEEGETCSGKCDAFSVFGVSSVSSVFSVSDFVRKKEVRKKEVRSKEVKPLSDILEENPYHAPIGGRYVKEKKASNKEIFYFLMLKLGKLNTGFNRKDREIVKDFLTANPVKSEDLIENYEKYGISPQGISEIKKVFPLTARQKLIDLEDLEKIKDLGEEDLRKILYLFNIFQLDDFDKQKEYFDRLCELSDQALQFSALGCSSLKYFASLDQETTAYLNGFPMSGFKSHLAYKSLELKDCSQFLKDYSPFLEKVNHFVPFQFFSTYMHLCPKPTQVLSVVDESESGKGGVKSGSSLLCKNKESGSIQKGNHRMAGLSTKYTTINLEECLKNLIYPIGLPTVYAKTANQKGFTLKKFLNRNQKLFFPYLWKIVVSGEITFQQDLLLTGPLKETKTQMKREEFYQPSQIEGGKNLFELTDLSSLTRRSTFLQNAVITQDLLESLQKICSKNEMGEIYDLDVETSVFWKQEDCVESLQDWYQQAIIDRGSFSYQEKESVLSDSRTRKWYPVKLSEDFIEPLIREARNIKEEGEKSGFPACKLDLSLLIDAIYRVFTSSQSICGNVVVADVITARARLATWQISKSLFSTHAYINPISCGVGFSVKTRTRKPALQKLAVPNSLMKHRNVEDSFTKNLEFDLEKEWQEIENQDKTEDRRQARGSLYASHRDFLGDGDVASENFSMRTIEGSSMESIEEVSTRSIEEVSIRSIEGSTETTKHEKLLKNWAKVISTFYPHFSNEDLGELEKIIKGEGRIKDKINFIAIKTCVKQFWSVYKLSYNLPVMMIPQP